MVLHSVKAVNDLIAYESDYVQWYYGPHGDLTASMYK